MSKKAIERIFSSRNELIENYVDFPRARIAIREFKERMPEGQWKDMEAPFFNATDAFEEQGFIYGFWYAVDLFVRGGIE